MRNILIQVRWFKEQTRGFVIRLTVPIIIEALLSFANVSLAIILKFIIDKAGERDKELFVRYCVLLIFNIVIQVILEAVLSVMKNRNTELMSNSIRQNLFSRVKYKQWLDISRYHSGDILTRLTSDISNVTNIFVNTIPDIVSLGVSLVASLFTLLYFKPSLALIGVVLGPVTLILSRLYARKLKKINIKIQQLEGYYRSFLQESLQNIVIIKTFCLEKFNDKRLYQLQNEKYSLVDSRGRLTMISNSALSLSYWVGYIIALGIGVFGIFNGSITFGTLTAFTQLIGKIQGPFTGLAYAFPQLVSASSSIDRLLEIEMIRDEKSGGELIAEDSVFGIEFENVSFFYEQGKDILNNITTQICPGDITAIVGPSGQGKTTLIRLILSLINPNEGSIYITNGKKKFEINAATRELISYVPQGDTLFSGTIEQNLRFGSYDASEDEIVEALKSACAWEFIKELENGIYTVIGENGVGLSAGQAQRLAIARAFLRKKPIIIFDEATSSLDSATEISILNSIASIRSTSTILIITHRPAALKICNRVLTIKEGVLHELTSVSS